MSSFLLLLIIICPETKCKMEGNPPTKQSTRLGNYNCLQNI
uniref:Uncharacterized protein n=1 Tax=Anguilla anguilla TaxID=7936 RepID=A0A0E9VNR1_ANGAN